MHVLNDGCGVVIGRCNHDLIRVAILERIVHHVDRSGVGFTCAPASRTYLYWGIIQEIFGECGSHPQICSTVSRSVSVIVRFYVAEGEWPVRMGWIVGDWVWRSAYYRNWWDKNCGALKEIFVGILLVGYSIFAKSFLLIF